MTKRSVILGLVSVAALCALAYLNDNVLLQSSMIGSQLPVAVFGVAFAFSLLSGGVFTYCKIKVFSGGEIALVISMMLAACCIPSYGFLKTFLPIIIMPHHLEKTDATWQAERFTDEIAPKHVLVNIHKTVFSGKATSGDEKTVTLSVGASGEDDAYSGTRE